jgi:hypothetical protein
MKNWNDIHQLKREKHEKSLKKIFVKKLEKL